MKKIDEILNKEIKDIRDSGLYNEERYIESAQSSIIGVTGENVINFCERGLEDCNIRVIYLLLYY